VARRKNDWQAELFFGDDFNVLLSCTDTPLISDRIYRNVEFGS